MYVLKEEDVRGNYRIVLCVCVRERESWEGRETSVKRNVVVVVTSVSGRSSDERESEAVWANGVVKLQLLRVMEMWYMYRQQWMMWSWVEKVGIPFRARERNGVCVFTLCETQNICLCV